ncbi:hypothetical protein F4813DRAFT_362737 [Daldinia decipiens]|uniref:uncharacterized protein n=1 Tax=Daldinia decipiens TaxID=326647 RepID=UPI0020C3ACC5|nr:uncharacterized protein F4813DRAFT_362737 [Daldinia decipiens]KAI1656664.1 hypothetical protein F4813DRAFT_362737 [Daldinia decipiens]
MRLLITRRGLWLNLIYTPNLAFCMILNRVELGLSMCFDVLQHADNSDLVVQPMNRIMNRIDRPLPIPWFPPERVC